MGELYDRMARDLRLKNYATGTQTQYLKCCCGFVRYHMKSPVKLQDLFVNWKIPRGERGGLIVAETAAGEIFWVERLRIAERFKLSSTTNRCLQWQWKRL